MAQLCAISGENPEKAATAAGHQPKSGCCELQLPRYLPCPWPTLAASGSSPLALPSVLGARPTHWVPASPQAEGGRRRPSLSVGTMLPAPVNWGHRQRKMSPARPGSSLERAGHCRLPLQAPAVAGSRLSAPFTGWSGSIWKAMR